jgi:S1-C subfamily serine protease
LVTNKHVLKDAAEATLQFNRDRAGKPVLGDAVQARISPLDPSNWYGHPGPEIDVAVLPLGLALDQLVALGHRPFFRAVPESHDPYDAVVKELDALERVIFIGYPAGLYDSANLTPIARQGLTATPIALDYNGLPAFLIDAAVFPGSSGSPVFLFDRGTVVDRAGDVTIGSRFYLLGVLAAVHVNEVAADVSEAADRLVARFRQEIGLGIVFKTSTINQCVDLALSKHGFTRAAVKAVPVPQIPSVEGTSADKEIT